MRKFLWLFVALIVLGLVVAGFVLRDPLLTKAYSLYDWFSEDAFAMRALPACARQNADMTVVGYEAGMGPGDVVLSIAVTVPKDDPGNARFNEAHRQLFACLGHYSWNQVQIIYLWMEKDGKNDYQVSVAGILLLPGEVIRGFDLEKPVLDQIGAALGEGTVIWIPSYLVRGSPFQQNADWQLAIQRYEKTYGK